jgi:hypothetical protein
MTLSSPELGCRVLPLNRVITTSFHDTHQYSYNEATILCKDQNCVVGAKSCCAAMVKNDLTDVSQLKYV